MNNQFETMTTSKPYLIRAIYDWILDNQMTPHLAVAANYPQVIIPVEYVERGQIVFNIAPGAVRDLVLGNEWIQFSARFGGLAREISFPSEAVIGIFARENGKGMLFSKNLSPEETQQDELSSNDITDPPVKPTLRPVVSTQTTTTSSETDPPSDPKKGKGKSKGGPVLKIVK